MFWLSLVIKGIYNDYMKRKSLPQSAKKIFCFTDREFYEKKVLLHKLKVLNDMKEKCNVRSHTSPNQRFVRRFDRLCPCYARALNLLAFASPCNPLPPKGGMGCMAIKSSCKASLCTCKPCVDLWSSPLPPSGGMGMTRGQRMAVQIADLQQVHLLVPFGDMCKKICTPFVPKGHGHGNQRSFAPVPQKAKSRLTSLLTGTNYRFVPVRREVLVSKRLCIKASSSIKQISLPSAKGLYVCEKKSVLEIVQQIKDAICKNQLIEDSTSAIVSISGGQDSIFLLFSLSFLQSKITFTFKMLWCNHFWQTDSFYTTLHLTMCALNFRRSLITFIPLFVFNSNVLTSYIQIEDLRLRANHLTNRITFLQARLSCPLHRRGMGMAISFALQKDDGHASWHSHNRSLLCNQAKLRFSSPKVYKSSCKAKLCTCKSMYDAKRSFVKRFVLVNACHTNILTNEILLRHSHDRSKHRYNAKQRSAYVGRRSSSSDKYKSTICKKMMTFRQRTRIPKVIRLVRRFAMRLPSAKDLRSMYGRRPFAASLQEALHAHPLLTLAYKSKICKPKAIKSKICKPKAIKSLICKQSFALRDHHQRFALANKFVVVRMTSETIARHWRHLTTERSNAFYTLDKTIYGHTLSDRVETIMFNLIRGTGNMKSLLWKRKFSAFFYNRFFLSFQHLLHNTHFN